MALNVWNCENYRKIHSKSNAHRAFITYLLRVDKFRFVSCGDDQKAKVWKIINGGTTISHLFTLDHESTVNSAQVIEKELILTCTQQGVVSMWDIKTGLKLKSSKIA